MQVYSAKRDNGIHLHFYSTGGAPTALSATVARNVRRLRLDRGYDMERLAMLADIDLRTLTQVETGKGEPTLEFVWRIANALDVPFAAVIADSAPRGSVVIRKSKANIIVSEDLGLTTRALLPFHEGQCVGFYELLLAPHQQEASDPHKPGTIETLFVAHGALEVTVGREPAHLVNKGDSICFPADLPHAYRNLTPAPATLYLVMTYPESVRTGSTQMSYWPYD